MGDVAIWMLGAGALAFVSWSLSRSSQARSLKVLAVTTLCLASGCDLSSLLPQDVWTERQLRELRKTIWSESPRPAFFLQEEITEFEDCALAEFKKLAPGPRAARRVGAAKMNQLMEAVGAECSVAIQTRILEADTWAANFPLVYEHSCRITHAEDPETLQLCLCIAKEAKNHFDSPKALAVVDNAESFDALDPASQQRLADLWMACE